MKIQLLSLSFPFFRYLLLHLTFSFSSYQLSFPKSLYCPLQFFHIHFNKKLLLYTLSLRLHGVNRQHLLLAAWFQSYAFIFFPHQLWIKARGLSLCYPLVHSRNTFSGSSNAIKHRNKQLKRKDVDLLSVLANQGFVYFFPRSSYM